MGGGGADEAPAAMVDIQLATSNPNKLRELEGLLEGIPVRMRPPSSLPEPPRVVEDGATLEDNARKKARTWAAAAGTWALADDSGLEVDALGGKPGVRSSRYAGDDATDADNNTRLLQAMEGIPGPRRTARFRCVLCLRSPRGEEILAAGTVRGTIAEAPRGHGGFGYDPLFVVPGEGKTFAELGTAYKQRHSHRARAMAALRERIAARFPRSAG